MKDYDFQPGVPWGVRCDPTTLGKPFGGAVDKRIGAMGLPSTKLGTHQVQPWAPGDDLLESMA